MVEAILTREEGDIEKCLESHLTQIPDPPLLSMQKSSSMECVRQQLGSIVSALPRQSVPDLSAEHNVDGSFVIRMVAAVKAGHLPSKKTVQEMILRVNEGSDGKPGLKGLPNIVKIHVNDPLTRVAIVGDIHGQLDDLLEILDLNGLPSSPHTIYVFNGDFVDRGVRSVEVMLVLLSLRLAFTESVFLLRGNHEARNMNTTDGFETECARKYDRELCGSFQDMFCSLPLCCLINRKVLVLHGGLSWQDVTLDAIQKLDRFHHTPPIDSLLEDLLWSDPVNKLGRHKSDRNCGVKFGRDVCASFLARNNLQLLVRSHECVERGFRSHFQGCCLTVFSASNYCDVVGNNGAFLLLQQDLAPRMVQYYANTNNSSDTSSFPGSISSNVDQETSKYQPKSINIKTTNQGKQRSRQRQDFQRLRQHIVSKILEAISTHRLELNDWFKSNSSRASFTSNFISRTVWAQGQGGMSRIDPQAVTHALIVIGTTI